MILEKIFRARKTQMVTIYVVFLISTVITTGIYFTESKINEEKNNIIQLKQNNIKIISSLIESKIEDVVDIMIFASKDSSMYNTRFSSYISSTLHGIPDHYDEEKRMMAQKILVSDGEDFESIRYTMPNGNTYFVEPYSTQLSFQQLNHRFSDWYRGGINASDYYISEAYTDQSVKKNTVAIEIPIRSNDGKLIGLLGSVIKLHEIGKAFSHLNLEGGRRIVVTDQNGEILYDTNNSTIATTIKSISNLESVKQALAGKDGAITESIDNVRMFTVYHCIDAGHHKWAVILTQPYDITFYSAIITQEEAYVIISIMGVMIATFSYFLHKKIQDDTKMKEILKVEKQKDEFASMISHELKSPLVPIIGYCEMLKTKDIMGDLTREQSDAINEIYDNSQRLQSLISDILDVRKLEMHKMKFNPEDAWVSHIIEETKLRYKEIMKSKNIEFSSICSIDHKITTDITKIDQIFDNLIQNAIDFVPKKGGRIEIGVRKLLSNKIMFYVEDNGIGIPKEKQSNLFKKFYQVDSTQTREHGGSGLGLAISKEIIEVLGGKIWVESQQNRGSTFCFTVPIRYNTDYKKGGDKDVTSS